MGNPSAKRKRPEGKGFKKTHGKANKKFKKQKAYHSDSDEELGTSANSVPLLPRKSTDFQPVNMDDSGDEEAKVTAAPKEEAKPASKEKVKPAPKKEAPKEKVKPAHRTAAAAKPTLKSALKKTKKPDPPSESEQDSEPDEADTEDSDDDSEGIEDLNHLEDLDVGDDDPELDDDEVDLSDTSSTSGTGAHQGKKRKRNDPTAFATSMSKILSTKLTTAKRQDPVLSRSAAATAASKEVTDARLEAKAKRQLHAEKRQALEKGRVKDVLGLNSTDISTADIQDIEKRLQKTAQRGVVKLFNAVRAAQVKGDQARSDAKNEGVVGLAQREERVSEMTKKGFLDLIAQGGKKAAVQEA